LTTGGHTCVKRRLTSKTLDKIGIDITLY